jgi:multimeric flavodoxin WrbA
MKVLAVNGSPRKTKNTAGMLKSMCKGAASAGAETQLIHLYGLKYTGCVSCFKCKLVGGKSYGRCAVRDGLTLVLQAAHEADVVILGSPIYFLCETGMMRSFMERFLFQYFLYSTKKPSLAPRKKAVALVYTANVREQDFAARGMDHPIAATRMFLQRAFGGSELFVCSDTKQMDDYSKYEVDYFDTAAKDKRHAEVFPQDLRRAFDFGLNLVKA